MTRTVLAAVICAAWIFGESADPRIIDLSMHLGDAATRSLQTSRETDVPATLRVGRSGEEGEAVDVMVHVKGQLGSARPFDDKPAFKIKIGNGDRLFGRQHLTLNNMVQDPTMLHEALGYQVYAAAGVAVPDTGYVRLTVNGKPYGVYLDVETIDRPFLRRRFGDDSGILYEGAYGVDLRAGDEEKFQLHEGRDPDHARLRSLIRAVDAPGDGVFYAATAQVDTASFLSMMAVEALIADWDNYYQSNNYRIYWNPSAQRWFFIPTGIDQTFGTDRTDVFGATGVLFQKCLGSQRCTADYVTAVRTVADRFERLGLPAKMDALLSSIGGASQADPKKPYDAAAMAGTREAMRAFIATRPIVVRSALSCMDGGRETAFAACAGAVVLHPASGDCMELVSRTPEQNGEGVRVGPCRGGVKQRWYLVPEGKAFALKAATTGNCLEISGSMEGERPLFRQTPCTNADNQLFSLRTGPQDTQIVAMQSGACVAVAPGQTKAVDLGQSPCTADPLQRWRVQRSVLR